MYFKYKADETTIIKYTVTISTTANIKYQCEDKLKDILQ